MNTYQELWWEQAKSDHDAFVLLRAQGMAQCHSLHYVQMATEKIAKAYFWRSGSPPPRSHAGFVQFLRLFLGHIRKDDRERIANLFSFKRFAQLKDRVYHLLPIAYELQRLAPDLAKDGPNPEYPWPHAEPKAAPANYNFPVWAMLTSDRGRDLMRVIQIAVTRFPKYADT